MTDNTQTSLDINRRNAIKALAAAAGAASIAALPSRWSKPTMMVGAVPAHAQASAFICTPSQVFGFRPAAASITAPVCITVSPPVAGIEFTLNVVVSDASTMSPDEATLESANPYVTDENGMACTVAVTFDPDTGDDTVEFIWTPTVPVPGLSTCSTLWSSNINF